MSRKDSKSPEPAISSCPSLEKFYPFALDQSAIVEDHGGTLWLDSSCAHTSFVIKPPPCVIQDRRPRQPGH